MNRRRTIRRLVLPPLPAGWRTTSYRHEILLWLAAAVLGTVGGATVVTGDPRAAKLLLLLPFLVLAVAIQPETIFVTWLFVAPLVQGASSGSDYGHSLFKLAFLMPPLILIGRMAMGSIRSGGLWAMDALPALYLAYVFISVRLLPSEFTLAQSATLTSVYISVGVGIAGYYFAAFARTSRRFPQMVAASFVWGGVVVATLAIVDGLTGWNLWHDLVVNGDIRRAVSTFPSPAELGAYLGAGVAFAVAILLFRGPQTLRLPSVLLVVLSVPALFFTYTRGPVLAIAAVTVVMALVANRARWPSLLVFAAVGALVIAGWGELKSSTVYKNRIGVSTVEPRVVLTDVAFDLFRERPLFGQGYATFDQAKLKLPIPANEVEIVATTTSHNTFLTALAESGVVGLALLFLPWLVIGWRAIAAARRGLVESWIVCGSIGVAAAYAIGAMTYDARFFPLIFALPWIALGLARKVLAEHAATAASFD
jgi:O-antigen ligase